MLLQAVLNSRLFSLYSLNPPSLPSSTKFVMHLVPDNTLYLTPKHLEMPVNCLIVRGYSELADVALLRHVMFCAS